MQPIRIQRQRTRGWKKPENTVNCTRPGIFGNRFIVGKYMSITGTKGCFELYPDAVGKPGYEDFVLIENNEMAVRAYENYLKNDFDGKKIAAIAKERLNGKNLMCFCKTSDICHVDVLLKISNE